MPPTIRSTPVPAAASSTTNDALQAISTIKHYGPLGTGSSATSMAVSPAEPSTTNTLPGPIASNKSRSLLDNLRPWDVYPLGLLCDETGQLIHYHGRAEHAPPRVDAASEFVNRPDQEGHGLDARQYCVDGPGGVEQRSQYRRHKESPQCSVGNLDDSDRAGPAIAEEPVKAAG